MSYSAMSKKGRNPYETLERMLNKTTLSTQRVAHSNIVGKETLFTQRENVIKMTL